MYVPFGKKHGTMFWQGQFGSMSANGSVPIDPWSQTRLYNSPFDEAFYIILNAAVGGTNGYFKDGYVNKPWVDQSQTAFADFMKTQTEWKPTWGAGDTRGMGVQSVKMYRRGVCGK